MSAELGRLRTVGQADVYKKQHRVGTLTRRPVGVVFAYDPDYLDDPHAVAAASTLPVGGSPLLTPAGAVPPYFAGLLPEGRRLTALRTAVKTSADDELSLLLAVGADAVGDVRVIPEGEPVAEVTPRIAAAAWSEVSFTDVFEAERGGSPDRVGLPGVQPKASAAMISTPIARGTDRFILKLDSPEFPRLCRNEFLMIKAARLSGLPTVEADLARDRDGREGLVVRRFDRVVGGELLAVEDGCQVLGRYPADKYNLSTEEVCLALSRLCDAPVVAARTLLRWVAFAYVSCNGDLHAKNIAVSERLEGGLRPCPAYDLPSSYPYGDTTMALSINGKDREDIGRADLLAVAAYLGVPERAAAKVLDTVAAAVDRWLPLLGDSGFDARLLTKWRKAASYRKARLLA